MKAFPTYEQELAWFIGIYEGEGSLGARRIKRTIKDKLYINGELYLTIKMTDEDTIARVARFLGNSYHPCDQKAVSENPNKKPVWRVRKNGGPNGKLKDLLEEMRPYLSERRREQLDTKIKLAIEHANSK
tara:strand:+ start:233 stop:622 length:390 start_codon:yes stop_codon:yes gene_type:complete